MTVSDTGGVTAASTLPVGVYTATGTDTDGTNTGDWSYSLSVNPATLVQNSATTNATAVTPAESTSFAIPSLVTTGGSGAVTFVTSVGSSPDLSVTGSGAITVPSELAVGTYTALGTDSDLYGDTGSWSYTLNVTAGSISQSVPFSNATIVTPAGSSGFTDQLDVTGALSTVTYVQETGSASLTVSGSGAVTVTGATTLAVGSYTATGSDSDTEGDTGMWSYTLDVTPTAISQGTPTSNTTTVTPASSAEFSDLLNTTGNEGPATFTASTYNYPLGAKTFMQVSTAGAVTTTGELEVGTYTASGTASDAFGDTSGNWTYTLTVTSAGVAQSPPKANPGVVTPASSTSFSAQLEPTSSQGPVTFAWNDETNPTGSARIAASPSGVVTPTARLMAGSYTLSGSDSDAYGDAGTWSYDLTVSPGAIAQTAPTLNSTTPSHSSDFKEQLATSENFGPASYRTTSISGPSGAKTTDPGVLSWCRLYDRRSRCRDIHRFWHRL